MLVPAWRKPAHRHVSITIVAAVRELEIAGATLIAVLDYPRPAGCR
jgi:hypothetical protein